MFTQILAPANPELRQRLLIWSGVTVGVEGASSLGALVARLNALLPQNMVLENFTYMSLAIGFVSALPLAAFPVVISVACAQLGIATGLMYLGYSVTGAFRPDYTTVIGLLMVALALVFLLIFSGGLLYLYRNRYWSDLAAGAVLLAVFAVLWVIPIAHLWG